MLSPVLVLTLLSQVLKPGSGFETSWVKVETPVRYQVMVFGSNELRTVKLDGVVCPPKGTPAYRGGVDLMREVFRRVRMPGIFEAPISPTQLRIRAIDPDGILKCDIKWENYEPATDFQYMAVESDAAAEFLKNGIADVDMKDDLPADKLKFYLLLRDGAKKNGLGIWANKGQSFKPGDAFEALQCKVESPVRCMVMVVDSRERRTVKLEGLIAPSPNSPAYRPALEYLRAIVRLKLPGTFANNAEPSKFEVRAVDPDGVLRCTISYTGYEPSVDFQFMEVSYDLGEQMLKHGYADFDPKGKVPVGYLKSYPLLRDEAKKQGLGIWAGKTMR